jgi:hypothetical protein
VVTGLANGLLLLFSIDLRTPKGSMTRHQDQSTMAVTAKAIRNTRRVEPFSRNLLACFAAHASGRSQYLSKLLIVPDIESMPDHSLLPFSDIVRLLDEHWVR